MARERDENEPTEMLARPPRPALRPFIRTLWAADAAGEPASAGARELMVPAGTMHVAVRLSGPPLRVFRRVDDEVGRDVGLAVVGGARAGFYVRDVSRPVRSVGAELEPGAAALLLGVPAGELAERHTPLDELWGRAVEEARERLDEARSLAERLDVFEALLAARLPRVRAMHPAVAHALGRLHAGADVGAVAGETGYSHRRFLTVFRDAVGLGPKVYGRLLRLNSALRHLVTSPDATCAAVAAAAGYSDQAHMTREFRELAGVTPGAYRAAAPASIRHVPVRGLG